MTKKRETLASLNLEQTKGNIKAWQELPNSAFNATASMQTKGNIGDSLESRSINDMMLGGGIDLHSGYGLMGSWPAQGDGLQIGAGQDGDPRSQYIKYPLKETTRLAWQRIQICRSIYENDGQISSIIDLMADFSVEGFKFQHKKKSVERFFNAWSSKIDIKNRLRRAIIDMLIGGMVFWYRSYATLTPKQVTTLKNFSSGIQLNNGMLVTDNKGNEHIVEPTIHYDSSIEYLFEKASETPQKLKELVLAKIKSNKDGLVIKDDAATVEANKIPWKYISLNPLQMVPNAEGGWSYLLTKDDVEKLINQLDISFDSNTKSIQVNLPDGISGNLRPLSGKTNFGSGFFAEMKLDETRLLVLEYGKFDWSKWAVPLLWKVTPTVAFKNALRAMEMKTARAGINTVTLWKLGDHNKGLLPTSEHFERLADMLKAPSSTLNVLWSSAIDAEVIQPKLDQIFDPKRWEELRKEVTAQFGITQAVMTGEGGAFSSSYISVQGLLQKLETLRSIILSSWLYKDILLITKAMSFRNLPKIIFGNMSLRDEKAEKTLIKDLLDRGYISDETAMEYLDRDIDVERRRLIDQAKFEDKNDMVRRGPFMTPDGQQEIVKMQLKSQEKMADNSNVLQEKQIKNDKEINQQKVANDHKVKMLQTKQDHAVNVQMAKDGKHPKQLKAVMPVKKVKKPKGRPAGTGGPQKNKRTPKPRQMASVDVANLIVKADEAAKQALTEVEGKKLYKELSKEGKAKVADLVGLAVAESLYEDSKEVTKEYFKDLVANNNDIIFGEDHIEFMQAFGGRCAEFKSREGRKPTKSELYSLYTDAYMSTSQYLTNQESD